MYVVDVWGISVSLVCQILVFFSALSCVFCSLDFFLFGEFLTETLRCIGYHIKGGEGGYGHLRGQYHKSVQFRGQLVKK